MAAYDTDRLRLAGAVGQFASGTRSFRLRRQLPAPGPELRFTMVVPQGDAVIPPAAPGVYSLEPLDNAGGTTGPAAAILVLTRPDPATEALFAEALAEVRTWPNADRALVNAYLTQAILALNAGAQP